MPIVAAQLVGLDDRINQEIVYVLSIHRNAGFVVLPPKVLVPWMIPFGIFPVYYPDAVTLQYDEKEVCARSLNASQ